MQGKQLDDSLKVAISTIQKLSRESNRALLQQCASAFDAVIVDEAHHATADTWRVSARPACLGPMCVHARRGRRLDVGGERTWTAAV